MAANGARNQLGYAVQLGTARFLSCFLDDPEDEHWFALAYWVYRRAWSTNERPIVLFDPATHRLLEARILLPGVSRLERLVSDVRGRVAARQYKMLAALPSPPQKRLLQNLVVVAEGNGSPGWTNSARAPPTCPAPASARPWTGTSSCGRWAPARGTGQQGTAAHHQGPGHRRDRAPRSLVEDPRPGSG
ncbi:DUF4158 domain-containing protein [Nonomuraea sp. NPDC049709]|uniref:DUF4158 domain-containing protein n=1 Tax=Nonomuraea sp. NPDC049709 TaxID=3154736 RepID=UPI00344383E7